jgi:hypothetical protein
MSTITIASPLTGVAQQDVGAMFAQFKAVLDRSNDLNTGLSSQLATSVAQVSSLTQRVETSDRLNLLVLAQLEKHIRDSEQALKRTSIERTVTGSLIGGTTAALVLNITMPGVGIPATIASMASGGGLGALGGKLFHNRHPDTAGTTQDIQQSRALFSQLSSHIT